MEHQDQLIITIRWQQRGFSRPGCPFYDALSSALIADVKAGEPAGELLAPFAAEPLEAAYVLRLFAGLHWLVLRGEAPALARHFLSAGGDGDARRDGGDPVGAARPAAGGAWLPGASSADQ